MRSSILVLTALVAACEAAPAPSRPQAPRAAPSATATPAVRSGAALFARHCAVCHGDEGRGDGPAAPVLFPPARDFGRARFRLVSTEGGAVAERDLVATLRRGMPGSAMPSWAWLGEPALEALARHVLDLTAAGRARDLARSAGEHGESLDAEAALAAARAELEPGPALPVPGPAGPGELERGAELFAQHCAPCHGPDGTGGTEPLWTEEGELSWARDLTAGYVKGGASRASLAHRIGAGLPGTAMAPTRVDASELAALVTFVRSLIPDGTESRFVQRAARIRVRRDLRPLPGDPDDPAWARVPEVAVVLAPLRWREESVLYASVSAVHDGRSIAIRLRWPDTSGPGPVFADTLEADAAALQLSASERAPLFGMGSPDEPTTLWHWRSRRLEDVAGRLDLTPPHALDDARPGTPTLDVPVYRRLEGAPRVSDRVDRITARGVEAAPDAEPRRGEVWAEPRWRDGQWSVVFSRSLEPSAPEDVAFVPGRTVSLACAVWNGAAGDAGAQKSISIWQQLALDP